MSQTVVPAAARSVITATPKTTLQVGTYNALTDTFTTVVDINDHVNYWLVKVELPQPNKVYSRTSTIRSPGERITNWNYQNRHITVTLHLLYESTTQALLTAVRSLLSAIENPPYRLAFAPPNGTVLTYADVLAVHHTIPSDGKQILAGAISNFTIDFECAPGLSGDRITLQNLVVNPGFEAPNGPAVNAFDDPLTTVNAYTVLAGSVPTAGSGTMNVPANTTITFGSPAWVAVNRWQIRMFFITGLTAYFYPHYVDGNNKLFVQVSGGSFQLWQVSGGSSTQLGNVTVTLTNTNYYWVVFTQYPAAPGAQAYLSAQLIADNLGNPTGAVVATITANSVNGASGGLTGMAAIAAGGAQLSVGGPYTHTNQYTLFGPGVWIWGSGGTGMVAGAWEQNTSNTYGGGPATSYASGRLDLPHAGTVSASWASYSGGTPAGAPGAIAAATGQTLAATVWAKSSSGLSGTGVVSLVLSEWDASGASLRSTTLASFTGAHTAWTQLSGTVTLGASTAYVSMGLTVADATAGASASATVWFDNVQCYNQTTTGQTTMPYCELRFPQSPAQWLLSGIQGDMTAPAQMSFGCYVQSVSVVTFYAYVAQRSTPQRGGRLVPQAIAASAFVSSTTPSPDNASYGGVYFTNINGTVRNHWVLETIAATTGAYHVFARVRGHGSGYATATLSYYAYEQTLTQHNAGSTAAIAESDGVGQPAGLSAANVWAVVDAGYLALPFSPVLATQDPTKLATYLDANFYQGSVIANADIGWVALLPIDGGVMIAQVNTSVNPGAWLWFYSDGTGANTQQATQQPTIRYSTESTPTPNPANAGSLLNNSTLTAPGSGVADAYLQLNPNALDATTNLSVAQGTAIMTDSNGAIYPFYSEVTYVPQYLYPREQ